jgi:hypothetical protein
MSQPERTRVSRWIRLRSFAVGKYKRVQLSIERRSFEGKLERIVRNALAHQSLGLPVGHPHLIESRMQRKEALRKFANYF